MSAEGSRAASRAGRRRAAAPWWLTIALGVALASGSARAETPLPPERLRDAAMQAWDGGRYLAAYTRLAQYLARAPGAADRPLAEERMARAREALVRAAPAGSLVVAAVEQRRDSDHPSERAEARLAARDGQVVVESMQGPSAVDVRWQRAGAAAPDAYAALVGRLLDAPVFRIHLPIQMLDPNLPGPRRGVTLRIEIGGEAWEGQALRGEPYDALREAAARVFEFARSTPLDPAPRGQGAAGPRS